ncbi:MAG: hypothetical protein GSR85_03180 [Desulfurococcales archaeon]|nr:hypothetical protein [Desulfurococcales archaeon]
MLDASWDSYIETPVLDGEVYKKLWGFDLIILAHGLVLAVIVVMMPLIND